MGAARLGIEAPALLLGGEGMLGRAWRESLEGAGIGYAAPGLEEVDFTDPKTIEPIGRGGWRTVINCAAYTDVDGAEQNEGLAERINGWAVGELARGCAGSGALLVHYSTDYVFDGLAAAPYRIDERRSPVGAYGRSKALGEEMVEESGCRYLMIRTSWLYAPWGKNFVGTIAGLLASRPEIRVVADQRGRPTSAEHLARISAALLVKGVEGTRHVTDGGECSWFELASEIARLRGGGCVKACTTAEYPRAARRPAYSVLDLAETEGEVGAMPHWRANLADVLMRAESAGR